MSRATACSGGFTGTLTLPRNGGSQGRGQQAGVPASCGLSPHCGQLFLLKQGLGLYPGFNLTERKSSFNSFLFGIAGKEVSSRDQ